MVLAELGQSITSALAKAATSRTLDQSILDEILKEIATALLQADVNVKLVAQLRNNVKRKVNMDDMAGGLNKQRVIEQAVFSELCAILDPGTKKL